MVAGVAAGVVVAASVVAVDAVDGFGVCGAGVVSAAVRETRGAAPLRKGASTTTWVYGVKGVLLGRPLWPGMRGRG